MRTVPRSLSCRRNVCAARLTDTTVPSDHDPILTAARERAAGVQGKTW
jgi:hypothetical protein